MRKLIAALVVLVIIAAGAYVAAGRAAGPPIQITKPEKFANASSPVEVAIGAPGLEPTTSAVFFEQDGRRTAIAASGGTLAGVPNLKSGPARIVVTASRKVLWGLRHADTEASHDFQVRLEHPRVSIVSTKHYINLGGSEMVVYRVSPADVQSGVKVGDIEYPGFPAAGAVVDGAKLSDPALRVAFFALRYDQALNTPIALYARDVTGEIAQSGFDHRAFPKPFKQSRIPIEDAFLDKVVAPILATTTEVNPQGTMIEKFLVLNGDLRKKNNATIAAYAAKTSPEMLWGGVVFHPFTNTKVEAAFADFRTYVYQGKEVDRQVHLGFDLASHANAPIVAANRGKVLHAAPLGIYGNAVIIDHGMGVQSLYGHLSSIGVKAGDMVEKDQEIGRSGTTGMAAGDHLHFTMLVNGQMVNPIEWWDSHWIQDRIVRKIKGM